MGSVDRAGQLFGILAVKCSENPEVTSPADIFNNTIGTRSFLDQYALSTVPMKHGHYRIVPFSSTGCTKVRGGTELNVPVGQILTV